MYTWHGCYWCYCLHVLTTYHSLPLSHYRMSAVDILLYIFIVLKTVCHLSASLCCTCSMDKLLSSTRFCDWLIEQGLTSHQTHYRSYRGLKHTTDTACELLFYTPSRTNIIPLLHSYLRDGPEIAYSLHTRSRNKSLYVNPVTSMIVIFYSDLFIRIVSLVLLYRTNFFLFISLNCKQFCVCQLVLLK